METVETLSPLELRSLAIYRRSLRSSSTWPEYVQQEHAELCVPGSAFEGMSLSEFCSLEVRDIVKTIRTANRAVHQSGNPNATPWFDDPRVTGAVDTAVKLGLLRRVSYTQAEFTARGALIAGIVCPREGQPAFPEELELEEVKCGACGGLFNTFCTREELRLPEITRPCPLCHAKGPCTVTPD